MHKLIWLLPITIVSIVIVLINEAAAAVPVSLHSFVSTEHQNHWHSSAYIKLMRKSLKSP